MVDNSEIAVSIHNLRMSYGKNEVLKGIDLEIPKGQIIGYLGLKGAGKTTTIKILTGIISGYSGTVKILGKDISSKDAEYKRNIGYVPEAADIYDLLTPFEYISFLGEVYGMDADAVNNKAKKLMHLFGIEGEYHSTISSLSRDVKQKLLLIASLIHNPEIIFLDEPLNGLDSNGAAMVNEIILRLKSCGRTIFYSSHVMEMVEKISDRIVLIDKGRIAADGTFEEVKQRCSEGPLSEIFNQLTGFSRQREIADEFMDILNEV